MSNPWLDRRVLAYAHQGGAKEAPTSTRYALERAVELGCTAIELDVHATADRHLVVCHDPTVDRTTNGTGAIATLTLEEIKQLDSAYWFIPGEDGEQAVTGRPDSDYPLRGRAPADESLTMMTLVEVLEAFPAIPLNLDIKQSAPEVEPYEDLVAQALLAAGRGDDVIVTSFNDSTTERFRALAAEIGTSALGTSAGIGDVADFTRAVKAGEEPPERVRRHVAIQVPSHFKEIEIVDERFVQVAHEFGLAVHVWTIDEPEEMAHLLGLGVDGIMTDCPSVLVKLLADAGAAWKA